MAIEFGKVEFVHLRDIWPLEADDFTPWLADNLHYISDAIGIPLDLVETEAAVERFSADILARDQDGGFALIENQLEGSDHTHLGQILTYLAGLEARTVVWVAREFEEAHLSAVRWLNENTPVDFSFFAVCIWVEKIGDSRPAPVFVVLAGPGDENVRAVSQPSGDAAQPSRENREGLSPRGVFSRDFWTHHADRHPDDGLRRGFAGYNPTFPVQGTEFYIRWYHEGRKQVGMWVAGRGGRWSRSIWVGLMPYLPALAQAVGMDPDKSRSRETAHIQLDIDISDPDNWPEAADWLHEKFEIYRRILSQPPAETP